MVWFISQVRQRPASDPGQTIDRAEQPERQDRDGDGAGVAPDRHHVQAAHRQQGLARQAHGNKKHQASWSRLKILGPVQTETESNYLNKTHFYMPYDWKLLALERTCQRLRAVSYGLALAWHFQLGVM